MRRDQWGEDGEHDQRNNDQPADDCRRIPSQPPDGLGSRTGRHRSCARLRVLGRRLSISGSVWGRTFTKQAARISTASGVCNAFVTGTATGVTPTTQDAQQVHDALEGFIGLGRMMAPKNQPELKRVFDGIRVLQEGQRIRIQVAEPEELAGKFLELWLKQ